MMQSSKIIKKLPYVITYMCQTFGVRDVHGKVLKSIYITRYNFYLGIFQINFPTLIII